MGQLLSLMVLGDIVAADANAGSERQQQMEQSAAGNSSSRTQYRTAHDDEGDDWETDSDRHGVQYTGSTDPGLVTLRWSCNDGAITPTERRQEDNFDEDGAGQRSEELLHYDPPSLRSWSYPVHTHRIGLDGSERPVVGSSGLKDLGASGREDEHLQLMRIMDIPDRDSRLQSLRRYLADAEVEVERRIRRDEEPPDPRLATNGAQRGAAVENEADRSSDSQRSRANAINGARYGAASFITSEVRTSMEIGDQRRPSLASSESSSARGDDAKRMKRGDDRITFMDRLGAREEVTDSEDYISSASEVHRQMTIRSARGRETPLLDTDVPVSEHGSATSVVDQHRLRSAVVAISQRRSLETASASTKNQNEKSGEDRSERKGAEVGHTSCRRGPPPDDDGGGGDSSSSSSDDRKRGNDGRRNDKREDSDKDEKEHDDIRGRGRKRRESTSRSPSQRRHRRKCGWKSFKGRQRDASSSVDRHSSRRKRRHQIKVDKYDGSSCVEMFLCQFEDIADYNDWNDDDKLAHLKAALTGSAKYLMAESKGLLYEDMKEKLRRRYSNREQQERFKVELRTRRRRADESLQDLSHDVERLVALAYPDTSPDMRDILGRDAFIDALNNASLEFKIREKETPTMAKALTTAMRLEALYKSKKTTDEFTKPRLARQVQQKLKPDGAADRSTGFGNNESTLGAMSSGNDQAAKSGKRNEKKSGNKQVAAAVRQDSGTTCEDDGRKFEKEFDEKFQQLESKMMESLTQQMNVMFSKFQAGQQGQPQRTPTLPPMQTSVPRQSAPHSGSGVNSQHQPFFCYECGGPGHIARNCQRRREAMTQDSNQPPDRVRMTNQRSYVARCNGDRFRLGGQLGMRRPRERIVSAAEEEFASSRVYLQMKIAGKDYGALLDTGCEVTVIPAKLVRRRQLQRTTRSLIAANGTQIPILGWTTIKAYVGSSSVTISGLVSEHVVEIMLGIDWLRENEAQWDFVREEVTIHGATYRLAARRTRGQWCRRVIAAQDITIPPCSQLDVPTKAVYRQLHTSTKPMHEEVSWATETSEIRRGLLVARTLLPNRADEIPVRVLNASNTPVHLNRGTFVSELLPVTPMADQQSQQKKDLLTEKEIIDDIVSRVDEEVSVDIKKKLREVLNRYSTVFSRGEYDLGWTNLVTHRIDTADHRPIRQQLRRYPPAHLEAIDEHLNDMLTQGVIEPAASPWASNIVLAKKKDGSLRCCIDFRQVNDITRKDAYPLPRTDQCLDAMNGSCWFSTFDLRSGFHQVALAAEDADKTAFITRRGMYRFRTMPFGLCNAVATFQRLMDLALTGLNFEICLAYLDDIILHSKTLEEHLHRLEMLLQRLQGVNLKLKPNKCSLMQKKVVFLGHVISGNGIATDPEKIKLVEGWPTPTNLKQLRGFLGLTGYYRKFVKGYAHIAGPLNRLLKKDQVYDWTEDCQKAFDALKKALVSPPILTLPNDKDMFVLDTDAADGSIGAVLSQVLDGEERVVAYAGRALNRNEVNYCITRKELLAIVHFTKLFRQYLLGRKFMIRTDHAALSWLQKTPEPIGQNARWLEQLGEYDFTICHRKGTSHSNADALSRHPCLRRPSCTACHPVSEQTTCSAATVERHSQPEEEQSTDMLGWSPDEIRVSQQEDCEIKFIIDLMEANDEKPSWDVVADRSADVKTLFNEWERLVVVEGLLLRKWTSTTSATNRRQVVMPERYRQEFIRLAHSGMTGGHLGKTKTQEQISLRAYWPSWKSDVSLELQRCVECAQYHRGKAPRQTPLRPFNAGEPFEVVSVDITGKHPKSSKGNEYIVTVIDIFSKWAEAYPVRTHTAPIVAKVLIDNFFSRFGMPRRILTDQGKEFESILFKELCEKMEIQKIRTSPYQPSTNGCVERFHRTLNAMIGKVIQYDQRNWDECLPTVMAAYRAAKHESTGFSPNRMILGRENRAPLDLVLGDIPGEEDRCENYGDFVYERLQRMKECYTIAREHLKEAARRRKDDYDSTVHPKMFEIGQWVWYYYPRRYLHRTPKWCKTYDGPFLITKVIAPCDYVIQKTSRSAPITVHRDKLKICHGMTPKSWLTDVSQEVRHDERPQDGQENDNASRSGVHESARREELNRQPTRRHDRRRQDVVNYEDGAIETQSVLPPRNRRIPPRFDGFQM